MSAALRRGKAEAFSDQAADHFNDPKKAGKLFVPDMASNAIGRASAFRYHSIEHAFPTVDPGFEPFGNLVLLQVRAALGRAGSIILTTEDRRTEQDNTQVARVYACGPLAFCNRNTGEQWPEGAWAKVGDYVRIPRHSGDRWPVQYQRKTLERRDNAWIEGTENETDEVEFCVLKDLVLVGKYTMDPLLVKAFW